LAPKFKKIGDTIIITLPCGRETIINKEDEQLLTDFTSWVYAGGYVYLGRSIKTDYGTAKEKIYLARAIAIRVFGLKIVNTYLVDHKNRERLCNLRSNLRLCSPRQNGTNQKAQNKTGFKGVCLTAHSRGLKKKFMAYISGAAGSGKTKNLGYHLTAEDAARAYDKEAHEKFGEFAYLNFPEEYT
jgi:hypothetical protein